MSDETTAAAFIVTIGGFLVIGIVALGRRALIDQRAQEARDLVQREEARRLQESKAHDRTVRAGEWLRLHEDEVWAARATQCARGNHTMTEESRKQFCKHCGLRYSYFCPHSQVVSYDGATSCKACGALLTLNPEHYNYTGKPTGRTAGPPESCSNGSHAWGKALLSFSQKSDEGEWVTVSSERCEACGCARGYVEALGRLPSVR